ncbi:FecR domain-containing protein [Novipirellula rosea]|uniref:FecR domain-containing protein n=1 Tax=Novipirellula rosea TaxID=1031540 RepID=A0ABP8M941_9BACT
MNDRELIQQYLLGNLNDDDVARLDAKVCSDDEFRKTLADELVLDCNLRDVAGQEQLGEADSSGISEPTVLAAGGATTTVDAGRPVVSAIGSRVGIKWAVVATLAVVILVAVGWNLFSSPDGVATLVSSEDAAWVSGLPTSVGSHLPAGELQLISGIATLRFDSGATMILEAPARLELQTDMRAFLHDGAAVLEVPDSAIGFVVATPSGEATDLGTSFAVNVDSANATSEFEVLMGSISVGLPSRDERVLLKDNQAVRVDSSGISEASAAENPEPAGPGNPTLRIQTDGNESTFVRGGTSPGTRELLMVKSSWKNNLYDRKAVFSFDASGVDIDAAVAIRLRLNQVESEMGFASRLPPVNVFQVYAVANVATGSWDRRSTWEDAPSPEDGVLVGEFEIPRSRKSGECILESDRLAEFVRSHADRPLTFVVIRATKKVAGDGRVLVHAFASHSHPSSVGPTLEFEMRED